MSLTDRKKSILKTIISDYIHRAEPIGSRTLSRKYILSLSPATLRNEMADLEEMGYLIQPHTSAGRVPTEKGYRFFVDDLIEPDVKEWGQNILWERLKQEKVAEIEEIIQLTARVLSDITEYTSIVLGPQTNKSSFNKMQLIPIDEGNYLMVLITDTGIIEHKTVTIPNKLSKTEARQIVNYLNNKLYGLSIDSITPSLLRELRTSLIKEIDLLEEALEVLSDSFKEGNKIALGGTSNILNQPEFNNMEKIKELLSIFEREELLMELLTETDGLVVRIGAENPFEEVKDCSVITASYELSGRPLGTIGVLGPTRMDYSKVIAIVAQIAKELSKTLHKDK